MMRLQLKKLYDDDATTDAVGNNQSMFVILILEKNNKTRLKFSQGSETVY